MSTAFARLRLGWGARGDGWGFFYFLIGHTYTADVIRAAIDAEATRGCP